jgi:TRAP transporter TAXI family solute receptor
VAGLVTALGTGPKGLVGIASGGNKAGDAIRAHGTAIYKRDGGRWAIVAAEGFQPAAATAFDTRTQRPVVEQLMQSIAKVFESSPPDLKPLALEVTQAELSQAQNAIRGRLARIGGGYAVAAGPENGQYMRWAQAVAAGARVRVVALVTAGGEENLALLRGGKVSLAMAQGDVALMAFEGKGPFASAGADLALRAVGSLYPETVHVVTQADSPIRSMADLRGRSASIGATGSASRITALAVLAAHGLKAADLALAAELDLNGALQALRDRRIDALIQVIGSPADSIRSAASVLPLRFVPLEASAVQTLAAGSPVYYPHILARGTYEGQQEDVPSLAVSAVLFVGSDLTEPEVADISYAIYSSGQDLVARGSVQGAQISAKRAMLGLAVPQHIGAGRAIEKLMLPSSGTPQDVSATSPAK